ncbi:patatin-like phospholipase family protein [Leptothrix discophora]|uniref:Patatin-like phospholipase family protein n=1 Tax=Leptothrix discophora TaxID=89 RepID=A0ABT9G729_LEPDI|nr:patatin-like phospholipase family protein [Leptothrix discophora]MDP4302290.1 patatin-like phospholipase family protein [Leptothrix discophora]
MRLRRTIPGLLLSLGLTGAFSAEPLPHRADAPLPVCGLARGLRPCVGLVLSGGGARGLAHVGVLQVLQRERIPVDLIAGTSMGAIIGGLHASGMGAAQLELALQDLDWEALFANRLPRESLPPRRKDEDQEISPVIEIGLGRDGTPMLPLGPVSSRGLELLLRRRTLSVRAVSDFDRLPIPFRAVATDMESGAAVVFSRGDLAQALRASMSVPGVFPPSDVQGRLLGDGGLVDNLPVEVARRQGADVVIAVNVGTPLAGRETLGTVVGLTAQMINILTEQNVQRSLASLRPGHDLLIAPALGSLSSADFGRSRELIARGQQAATAMLPQLQALALPEDRWQALLDRRLRPATPAAPIASLRFEGADISQPELQAEALASRPGTAFDLDRVEADTRVLSATGDYLHADYRLEDLPAGTGLVFSLVEKPWGPDYFRLGLEMASDFAGRGDFNLKLGHNRHWLSARGAEWRNRAQIGSVPRWFSEVYQPVGAVSSGGAQVFVALQVELERRRLDVHEPIAPGQDAAAAVLTARQARTAGRLGLDVGRSLGALGEWRIGLASLRELLVAELTREGGSLAGAAGPDRERSRERGLRALLLIDQLDHVSFPRSGHRLRLQAEAGRRLLRPDGGDEVREDYRRYELDAQRVASDGPHTIDAGLRWRQASQSPLLGRQAYSLGGFHNLSGYAVDQLNGNATLLARLTWTLRLNTQPVLTRGFFAGATLETGNAWRRAGQADLRTLRPGSSLFVGADTGLGPLYFGTTWAPQGSLGLFLRLGRP